MACDLLLNGNQEAQKGRSEARNDEDIQGDGRFGVTNLVGATRIGQSLPPRAGGFGRGSRTGSTVHSPLASLALGAGMAVLAAVATVTLSACSTNQPRDMNDGTDVGLFYVPTGANDTVSADAATTDADNADSEDSAVVDGGTSAEAPVESAM